MRHPHNLPLFLRAKQDGRAAVPLLCLASVYHRQMWFSITKAGQSAKTAPKPPRKQILSVFRYTTGPIPWYYKKQNDGAGRLRIAGHRKPTAKKKGRITMQRYLVLDIGGTFIKYALMGQDGTILEQGKVPSPQESMDALLAAIAPIGAKFAGQYAGTAVSMPGRINTARGVAHTGGIFTFIKDAPMARLLADCLHAPVTIANDGKCAVRAEAWNGALADVENGAVIVLGTGTGGGLLLGRRVWMGSSYAAGELSVLGMDFARMARACTDVTVLSRDTLWSDWMSAKGLLDHYTSRRGLPEGSVDGYAFFDAYEAGEPEAADTLRTFGEMAAAGIYSLQAVLDLQRIAIGGGISARPEVTRVIREAVTRQFAAVPCTPMPAPEIVTCRYGNDANLLGALQFHLEYRGE